MSVKLYWSPVSPPCRATLLTVKALNIEVELVPINLATQENLSTDFLKINPFHTIPAILDGSFNLWDSHAINSYLVDKFGNEDSLYPKDLAKRATVNQRLHFDSSVLTPRLGAIVGSIFREGAKIIAKDKVDALVQGLTLLETLLEKSKFVAGDALTIADFSIVSTVSTANLVAPLASNRFPKTFDWLGRMQALPYYREGNQEGLDALALAIKQKNFIRQNSTR